MAGESNLDNNESQENVLDFYTGSASPWHPVSISLDVANPMPKPARVDIGVNGLPAGWKVELDKTWVTLPQKGRETVTAVITPNPTDPQCMKVVLDLHGVMRLGDVWMPYSGFTPVVKLANPIQFANTIAPFSQRGQNFNARVKGCTSPGQPNREIAIQVKGPNGKTVVHFVTTDSSGCFDKLILAPIGGTAEIKTYFSGSDCAAPTESAGTPIHPPEPFLPGRLFAGASGGSQIALHPLWRNYWGGVHVNGHLEVDVAPGWRAAVQAGYHGFFPRSASVKYAAVTHYSVLAKYHRPLIGSMQLNAFGGAGLYRSPSATNPGMQLGAGVESAHSSNVRFFAHVTTHQTTVASQLGAMRWVDFSVGFSVRAR